MRYKKMTFNKRMRLKINNLLYPIFYKLYVRVEEDKDYDQCLSELWKELPKNQIKKIFDSSYCDIDETFIGFIDTYKRLSLIIPKHFTVIDLGCAYNPQCFYFTKHKLYVAVDEGIMDRFQSKNCMIYQKRIEEFIAQDLSNFNLDESFAICNYVPLTDKGNELVRKTFPNIFVYYPCDSRRFKEFLA